MHVECSHDTPLRGGRFFPRSDKPNGPRNCIRDSAKPRTAITRASAGQLRNARSFCVVFPENARASPASTFLPRSARTFWPIASFRYATELGLLSEHSGLWQRVCPADLWVHGLATRCSIGEMLSRDVTKRQR